MGNHFSSVAQSCPTLCDPMNRSMPGLSVHYQVPESTQTHVHQVSDAIQPSPPLSSPSPPPLNLSQHQGLFKRVSSSHQVAKVLDPYRLNKAHQAPLPMGFSRQEYWSGLPCPPPGDLPDPVIKPMSPVTPALAGGFFTTEPPGKPHLYVTGWDKSPSWLSLLNFLIFTEV